VTTDWPEPVVVISPHFDDAALSLGATISMLSRHGVTPTVVTVMANDPETDEVGRRWDLICGFANAADAARGRRDEDLNACELMGAKPIWLNFADREHEPAADDDEIQEAIRQCVGSAATVLVPGFPLLNVDHARVSRLILKSDIIDSCRVGLYFEQPYAAGYLAHRSGPSTRTRSRVRKVVNFASFAARGRWNGARQGVVPECVQDVVPGPVTWEPTPVTARDWVRKQRAIGAYTSQLRPLGPFVRTRIGFSDFVTKGERIAWIAAGGKRATQHEVTDP
jgi:LmbE family N-acetylglucosaminyl deacetylase